MRFLILMLSCSSFILLGEEGVNELKSNEELVDVILSSKKISEKEKAIRELKDRKDWRALVSTLPPKGEYGAISIQVINAVCDISDIKSLPYLEKLKKTDKLISGQFWVQLDAAIKRLKNNNSRRPKAKIPDSIKGSGN